MPRFTKWVIPIAVVGGLAATVLLLKSKGPEAGGGPLSKPPDEVQLAVPGRSNAFVSLASVGDTVVAVWGATTVDGASDVYSAVSQNGGAGFSSPRRVNDLDGDADLNGEQAPRVAVTPQPSGSMPTMTVVWPSKQTGVSAIRMARSVDGGQTFSKTVTVHDSSVHGARGWQSLAAAPDGSVYAVWLDGRHGAHAMPNASAGPTSGMEMHKGAPRQDVFYATWQGSGPIREAQLATDVCFCCKTAVAVDRRGVVYAAWRDLFPDSIRDIAFSKSTDGGKRFDPPVRVSVDNWKLNGCPEDGPSIAIDQAGTVHVVWPTLVDGPEPHKGIFYATSRDGRVFSSRARLDGGEVLTPAHPQVSNWGTTGLIVVWDEVRNGRRQVIERYTPTADQPESFRSPISLSSTMAGAYPTAAAVSGGAVVAWTSGPPASSAISVRRVLPAS